jgi:hypothetical protein
VAARRHRPPTGRRSEREGVQALERRRGEQQARCGGRATPGRCTDAGTPPSAAVTPENSITIKYC